MARRSAAWFAGGVLIATALAAPAARGDDYAMAAAANRHPVSTTVPAAQAAFDQGMLYRYAFNPWAAERMFRRAAALDPGLAMAHWGIALALGPDINNPAEPARAAEAAGELATARALAGRASPAERAYIAALSERDPTPETAETPAAANAYAAAMAGVARNLPQDPDAAALYAESLMNLQPQTLFYRHGVPVGRTTEIVTVLQPLLRRAPLHWGANHLFIHVVAQRPNPVEGLPSAEFLAAQAFPPAASHLAHMAVHIFYRVGRYADAIAASDRALRLDAQFMEQEHPPAEHSALMYHMHNLAYKLAAELMAGSFAACMETAEALQDPEAQLHALIRFGHWAEILDLQPPADGGFSSTDRELQFARVIAADRIGRAPLAAGAAAQFDAVLAGMAPEQRASDSSRIEAALIAATLATANAQPARAVAELQAAVAIQDAIVEPDMPAFFMPVREWLAAALAAAGHTGEAKAVLQEALRRDPADPRAQAALAALP